LATLQEPLPALEPTAPAQQSEQLAPIEFSTELSLDDFVVNVEARYPSLDAMLAAWQAAAQRYPQVVALDDPMFMGMTAPASWNSPTAETAYVLELRQKYPWFGKRPLRGTVAQQDANAAYHEYEDARQALRQIAQAAYYDYFLASRQLQLNAQNVELQGQFRETAQARYRTNQTTVQDVLQADVELADLQRRRIELDRQYRSSVARINILLRQPPFAPIPPPTRKLQTTESLPDVGTLQQIALAQRQDLAAIGHRIQAAEASLALAHKQYYPDVDVFGRYDTFWQPASAMGDLRAQAGFAVNLPVYHHKLRAAVWEAQAQLSRRHAEYQQKQAEIEWEVQSAYLMTDESLRLLAVYREQLVPTATQNVAAVRANYEAGKASFLDLAQANRQLIMMQERQIEAVATLYQRRAQLDRAVGVAASSMREGRPR
jgi:outer membrane protein TolC